MSERLDLNTLEPQQIIELAYSLLEPAEPVVEKTANANEIDLNSLTVAEFLEFASELEIELESAVEKTAAAKPSSKDRVAAFLASKKGAKPSLAQLRGGK